MTASAASIPTITVDMAERTYWWDLALDSFPAHPVDLVVHSIPRADAQTPSVRRPIQRTPALAGGIRFP